MVRSHTKEPWEALDTGVPPPPLDGGERTRPRLRDSRKKRHQKRRKNAWLASFWARAALLCSPRAHIQSPRHPRHGPLHAAMAGVAQGELKVLKVCDERRHVGTRRQLRDRRRVGVGARGHRADAGARDARQSRRRLPGRRVCAKPPTRSGTHSPCPHGVTPHSRDPDATTRAHDDASQATRVRRRPQEPATSATPSPWA